MQTKPRDETILDVVNQGRRAIRATWAACQSRSGIFVYAMVLLSGLLALAGLYLAQVFTLPGRLESLPIGVPWFGAVGAVMISLTGVFEHASSWDPDFVYWHWSRPLIGATLGIVSVLILRAGILAVGSTPSTSSAATAPKNLLYYLVAFAVGYREQTFRELLKRLLDVILAPGGTPVPAIPAVLGASPTSGPVSGGTVVALTGAGLSGARNVKFGTRTAAFSVDSDHHLTATAPPAITPGPAVITVELKTRNLTGPTFTYQSS